MNESQPPLPCRTKGERSPSIVEAAEAFSDRAWDAEAARRLVADRAAEIEAAESARRLGRFRS